jgi:hypothetical protein
MANLKYNPPAKRSASPGFLWLAGAIIGLMILDPHQCPFALLANSCGAKRSTKGNGQ